MKPPETILVTGASSGLGAGLALSYAAPGRRLILVGRDAERLDKTAGEARAKGATVETAQFDVALAEPFGEWLLARDAATPIDLLLPCAGTSSGPGPDGMPEGRESAARQVATNLIGTINTIEPLLPRMIARRAGALCVISSSAALRGLAYSPGYSASKAGVRAYGEGLRALLAPHGIAMTVVVPGFFDTPMTDRWQGPTPFMVSLDKMVAVIRAGLDGGASRVTYPRLLALGQRAADLMPPMFGDRIMRGFRFHIEPGR